MRIETVQTGFHTADLFDSMAEDVMTRVDTDASAHRYADLLHGELMETFPGAEITINWEVGTEGVLPCHLQAQINGDQGHEDVQYIMACEEDAFAKDWVVFLSEEECATLGAEELAAERMMDEAEERFYEQMEREAIERELDEMRLEMIAAEQGDACTA